MCTLPVVARPLQTRLLCSVLMLSFNSSFSATPTTMFMFVCLFMAVNDSSGEEYFIAAHSEREAADWVSCLRKAR